MVLKLYDIITARRHEYNGRDAVGDIFFYCIQYYFLLPISILKSQPQKSSQKHPKQKMVVNLMYTFQ